MGDMVEEKEMEESREDNSVEEDRYDRSGA